MTVRVRLFAVLRERAGTDHIDLELPEGARVADALDALADVAGGLTCVMAVNREYADADHVLSRGDELALIPPVSGGAGPHVAVRSGELSIDALAALVRDRRAGAVVTFSGVTREVEQLEYEAYTEMAEAAMREIVSAAIDRHGLCVAAAEHRVGPVPLSEPSVIVAASAPHRGAAFEGAREIIDAIKEQAPIWKREVEGGEPRWVEGRVPGGEATTSAVAGGDRSRRADTGGDGAPNAGRALESDS
jgi:molybdopterin synthase catalytic subunit